MPVLQTAENLERVAYELAQDNMVEGVRYIEVRFAPQLHTRKDFTIADVIHAVCKGMNRSKKEHNNSKNVKDGNDIPFEYGIIVCALRSFNQHMSPYYASLLSLMSHAPKKQIFATASLELARSAAVLAHDQGLPVVGFGLAGEEAGYPADDHKTSFQHAHSHFIRKAVHAGEAYGPESIFRPLQTVMRIVLGMERFFSQQIKFPTLP